MLGALRPFFRGGDARFAFYRRFAAGSTILELGCGDASNLANLRTVIGAGTFHGADLLETNPAPDFLQYRRVDLELGKLPYEAGSFDGVVLCHVIEHLRSPLELGPEIHRVLKRGGLFYVEAPNWTSVLLPSLGVDRKAHGPINFYDDPTHRRPWSRHGLYDFLTLYARLEVEKLGTVRNWRRIPVDPAILAYALLARRRDLVIGSLWNLSGWAVYAVGRKADDGAGAGGAGSSSPAR